jgi:hypothetical protein
VTSFGEFSPFWAIVFFGQFFNDITEESKSFMLFYPRQKGCISFDKTKWVWLHILGDFVKISSGHPYAERPAECKTFFRMFVSNA